jgi:hypothetical protein
MKGSALSGLSPCRCVGVLWLVVFHCTNATEPGAPSDTQGLVEIRSLAELPPGVAAPIRGRYEIADLEPRAGSQGGVNPRPAERWFILAGIRSTYALIAFEERRPKPPSTGFHAKAFSLVPTGWVEGGEWIISARPHTLVELMQLIATPDSRALTARWREWQHQNEIIRRQIESDPHRQAGSLRAVNISDDEVRQIEGVVRAMIPSSIVSISGVVQGCPCEDGPGCTARVWVAAYRPERTTWLELSEINSNWAVGPVQQWYLESEKLDASQWPSYAARSAARQALDDRYPACASGSAMP